MTRHSIIGFIVCFALAGCTLASTATPRPTRSQASSTPAVSGDPTAPGPAATASPLALPQPSVSLPVQGSAREHSDHSVMTAPGLDGELFVMIPMREASAVLALLDTDGRPRAGWPVAIPGATWCDQLLPVEDGSVRVVCTMRNPDGNMFEPVSAFAFDPNGRLRSGWPVTVEGFYRTGRVVGEDLTLFVTRSLGDVRDDFPTSDGGLVTITADGAIAIGARVLELPCCAWTVGRDGIGYGVTPASADVSPQARISSMVAVGPSGVLAGWPVSFEGIASAPTSAADGSMLVAVASADASTSRIAGFEPGGSAVSASAAVPIATAEYSGDTGGCVVASPQAPVVARNGTIFLYSELDTAIVALSPSLETMPGWPFEPGAPLVRARPGFEYEHEAGYCPTPVVPATGPDGTLYVALQAAGGSGGGRLVAVGLDGRVRAGWPVALTSAGAEFWSVVVGLDGTIFAVAFEPEGGGMSSATILAIAPDSTVLWTATIIEP